MTFFSAQGHPSACGTTIFKHNIKESIETLDDYIKEMNLVGIADKPVDFEIEYDDLDMSLFTSIASLKSYYATGLKECNIVVNNIPINADDVVIKGKDSNTWSVMICDETIELIKFRCPENDELLNGLACTEGLYKKPRIDINYIQTHNLGKGIICLTACMAGRLSRLLVDNKTEEALAYYTKLSDTFDSVYCELQSHNTESQAFANKCIYEFCKNNKLSYVITTDAHMLSKDMLEAHSYFIEIAEDREVGESYADCYLQTETDVYNTLKDQFPEQIVQTGIENTYAIANSIENINIGLGQGNQMPVVKVDGDFKSHEEYLRHLVFSTFDEKFGHMSEDEQKVRRGRLDFELDVLYKVEYTDYFIMLYMLAKEARKRHIPLGYYLILLLI